MRLNARWLRFARSHFLQRFKHTASDGRTSQRLYRQVHVGFSHRILLLCRAFTGATCSIPAVRLDECRYLRGNQSAIVLQDLLSREERRSSRKLRPLLIAASCFPSRVPHRGRMPPWLCVATELVHVEANRGPWCGSRRKDPFSHPRLEGMKLQGKTQACPSRVTR